MPKSGSKVAVIVAVELVTVMAVAVVAVAVVAVAVAAQNPIKSKKKIRTKIVHTSGFWGDLFRKMLKNAF